MTTANKVLHEIKPKPTPKPAPLQFTTRPVRCNHAAQITLDYGTNPGPYVIVGINERAYCMGYLPRKKK